MKKAKIIENKIRRKSKIRKFITPDYEEYCVSNIPNTVLSVLEVGTVKRKIPEKDIESQTKEIKKVVLILIDSLGYNKFLDFVKGREKNIFNKMIKTGEFFPLTSTFPSITPVTLSSYTTGLTPQENGIISSSFYHEKIKEVISVLHFKTVGDSWPSNLKDLGIRPKDLLKSKTIFEKLKKKKIGSFVINYEGFVGSDFNEMLYRGSKEIAYRNYRDAFRKIKKFLKNNKRVFIYCYFHQIDVLLHDVWKESMLFNELKKISKELKLLVKDLDEKTAQETLFIVASDHGQVKLSKRKRIFLRNYPKLLKHLSSEPMGGVRSLFLKIKKGEKKEVEAYLKNKFKRKALILDFKAIEKKKLSGLKNMTKRNYKRMGDLLILPYENYVFIPPLKEEQQYMAGQHGGLKEEEMLVPFICVKASKLKD